LRGDPLGNQTEHFSVRMNGSDGRQVIGRIALGDEEALAALFREHAQVLYNFAVRGLQSVDDAAEAVSDLFLSVWAEAAGWTRAEIPVDALLTSRLREMLVGRSFTGGRRRPAHEVDLWALVSRPRATTADHGLRGADGDRTAALVRVVMGKCGAVSSNVLSLVYFGGHSIAGAAERLSMTPSECRSRLHVCLEMLGSVRHDGGQARSHDGTYSVCSAAHSLGALGAGDEPEYFRHLEEGCPGCTEDIARFASAAHLLPVLLPDVKLPPELLEKILFSLKLATLAGSIPQIPAGDPGGDVPAKADRPAKPTRPAAPTPAGDKSPAFNHGMTALLIAAIVVIAALGYYARTLLGKIDRRDVLIESLQEQHTDLILKYDRLAGISGFFESKGVVTVLNGTKEFPGLRGKIVWDTSGHGAMLQILNPPQGIGKGRFRVNAVHKDASFQIAEFEADDRDSGGALYRFFPVDAGVSFPADGFAVDATDPTGDGAGAFRPIMRGSIPGRP
jgi:RNA polymerase sigma-70 factor (ECF subfamily)